MTINNYHILFVSGAYGRDANKIDWDSGLDFRCLRTGQYLSIRDRAMVKSMGYYCIKALSYDNNVVFVDIL